MSDVFYLFTADKLKFAIIRELLVEMDKISYYGCTCLTDYLNQFLIICLDSDAINEIAKKSCDNSQNQVWSIPFWR